MTSSVSTALNGYIPTKAFNNPNGITQYVKIECFDTFGGILLSFSFSSMYFISSVGVINLTDSIYGLSGVAISTDKKIIWLRITGYRNYTITNLGKWAPITISDATTTAPSGFTFTTDFKQVAVKSDLTSYTKQVVVDDITETGPTTLAELLSLATAQMDAEQPYVCKLRGRGTGLYVGNIMTYQKTATPNYAMAQIIRYDGTMYKCNCLNGTWTITTI